MRAVFCCLGLGSSLCVLSGCASKEFKYVPAEASVALGKEKSEAIYAVPPRTPSGKIRIYSLGIADLKPEQDSKPLRVLHVRMAISNQSNQRINEVWSLNTEDQSVAFPNVPTVKPLFVNSDFQKHPVLEVQPRELRTVDLYFPLPLAAQSADDIREFDFHWMVKVGSQLVNETTAFNRIQIPPSPPVLYPYQPYPYGYGMGWGPVWWRGTGIYWN